MGSEGGGELLAPWPEAMVLIVLLPGGWLPPLVGYKVIKPLAVTGTSGWAGEISKYYCARYL